MPIHSPSGWANLSFMSERIVIHLKPGVTSSPFGPLGLFRPARKAPAPLNSPFGRTAISAHTPWFGVPPRMAWETFTAPPPDSMDWRIELPPRELPSRTTWLAPLARSTLSTSPARWRMFSVVEVRPGCSFVSSSRARG